MRLTRRELATAVLAGAALGVLSGRARAATGTSPPVLDIIRDRSSLPAAVLEMVEAIEEAVAKGDIEALRVPIEMNEMPPLIGTAAGGTAIEHLQAISGDGEGREVLAMLGLLLEAGCARTGAGTADESYVWPYLAELPLATLSPGDRVQLYRLVRGPEAKAMLAGGRWTGWKLGISKEGVWHYLETGAAPAAGEPTAAPAASEPGAPAP